MQSATAALDATFTCPADSHPLRVDPAELVCVACGQAYPLVTQIPCFTEPARLDAQQRIEHAFRDRAVELPRSRRAEYERRVERESVLRRLRLTRHDLVLDAGCGPGYITRAVLAAGADVVAVDFSLRRLQALRDRAAADGRSGNLRLAMADVSHLPLPPHRFSAIVCTQVLEHLPTPAARQSLLRSLFCMLRPGGTLVLTVYNDNESWRRRGIPAEGIHDSGIFYHAYTAEELRHELAGFDVCEICGVATLLPHTYRLLPRLGRLGRELDHRLERHAGLSCRWGQFLMARVLHPAA